MAVRAVLKGAVGLCFTDKAAGTNTLLGYGTYADVAAVEAGLTDTYSPGSVIMCPSGIYFRGTSGGTTNNWLTVTVS